MRAIAIALLLFSASAAAEQEWSQFRGPSRDGIVPTAVIPKPWPKSTKRAWQVAIGEGYSSPVVANGRAFLHSRRDPEEIVTAIDLKTGAIAWQQKYAAAFAKNQYATAMAKGPNSTPIVVGTRLFTLGVTGILTAWNTADGTIAWRQDYSSSIDTSKLFCGTAMSPLLEGGSLIVQVGSDVHGGRVLALDPATGKERWAWQGLGPGYASPLAVTIDGVRQIITHDQRIDRRHRSGERRIALVDSVPGRLAREHRLAAVDRQLADRVGAAAGHARVRDRARRRQSGRPGRSGRTPT